jgi:arylsulfatase A-like enzyme
MCSMSSIDAPGWHPGTRPQGFFDQSYHIPLIIADPRPAANASRGHVVAEFSEHVDICSTVLDRSATFISDVTDCSPIVH